MALRLGFRRLPGRFAGNTLLRPSPNAALRGHVAGRILGQFGRSLSNQSRPAAAGPKLRVFDSRTQTLQPFHPKPSVPDHSESLAKTPEHFLGPWMKDLPIVSWYMCGPTVYDHSHIGHARTYVSFDIIRRVLVEIGGFHVVVAMGITDVDDKIIRRANETNRAFHEVAKQFEFSFMQDMRELNVLPPSTYLRVSDRVRAITEYIEVLMERGYAYEPEGSKGSIYFDTQAFQKTGKHKYGKLARSIHDISEDQQPQEGIDASFKRHPADFVLWKASKEGEPFWESPWGSGRPGWHIECSVAASQLFGPELTIHSGGIDLQFPHHNNEIAQCEAFFDRSEWTQFWMHSGHLHIQGRKMSKSLKNFITIKEFLKDHSPHTFRMFCLLSGYRSNVDFSEDRIEESRQILASFVEFVQTVNLRGKLADSETRWEPTDATWKAEEIQLQKSLLETEISIREALLNDFATPTAVNALRNLISEGNAYINQTQSGACLNRGQQLLDNICDLTKRYFRIFGFPDNVLSGNVSAAELGGEGHLLDDITEGWIDFRGRIRQLAVNSLRAQKNATQTKDMDFGELLAKDILKECDAVRDEEMPKFGISLQDFSGGLNKWSRSQK